MGTTVTKWLDERLEAKKFASTLALYGFSLLALAPLGLGIALMFGEKAVFAATPYLAVLLVGAQYAIINLERRLHLLRLAKDASKIELASEGKPNPPPRYEEWVSDETFLGVHRAIRDLWALVDAAARSTTPVLISGEIGTGKHLVARRLHLQGPRRDMPMLTVDCANRSQEAFAYDLFGVEAEGRVSRGLFELANRGTLFLQNVEELSGADVERLAALIHEGRGRRLGGTERIDIDLRLIVSTILDDPVRDSLARRLRSRLFRNIDWTVLNIPPLRDRPDDILLLANQFLLRTAKRLLREPKSLSPHAVEALLDNPWLGNVAELEIVMEQAALISPTVITADVLRELLRGIWLPDIPRRELLRALESEYAAALLARLRRDFWRSRKW